MNKFNILFLHQIQWNFLTTSWNIFCKKIFRDPWNVYCQYAGHPPSQLGKNPKKNLLKFWIGKLLDCYQRFFSDCWAWISRNHIWFIETFLSSRKPLNVTLSYYFYLPRGAASSSDFTKTELLFLISLNKRLF